ncbi:MAG: penicillin-binding protein 2 [Ferruginibacter sp.]|nr:penicillin-binding protein 2 [Cytophagales bacterium]
MNENRKHIVQFVFLLVGVVYGLRLFYLQIIDTSYKIKALATSSERVVQYPQRGQIYDRKGKLVVYNTPVYDLMVVPKKAKIADTLAFCRLLEITPQQIDSLVARMKKERGYSRSRPSIFMGQLSTVDFAKIQDGLIDYPGFYVTARTIRHYPYQSMANTLGYVGEISQKKLEEQVGSYYSQGDYVGLSGLEASYEEQLRGKKGVKYVMVNVHHVEKGAFKNGILDTTAVAGESLTSTVDIELQQYAEQLMQNKVGSVVAIEPKTGEVLAMVSSLSYDPNLLAGTRAYSRNYNQLVRNPLLPLYNRPLQAVYRPGSIFKLVQTLATLQEGAIKTNSFLPDSGPMKCHKHSSRHNGLHNAIQYSCNVYFYQVFRHNIYYQETGNTFKDSERGLMRWREAVTKFGLGRRLGIDLPNEKRGFVPDTAYFNRVYGAHSWKFSNWYSMAIGEGELGVVPLQMANLAAIIANKGYYYTPHLVKGIGKEEKVLEQYTTRNYVGVDSSYFGVVISGMEDAVRAGTVSYNAHIDSVTVIGKTGTSENKKGQKDHSVFVAYAPKENPRIAIAVYVENAGFGGTIAAPIASLIMEKHIKGYIPKNRKAVEKMMIEKNFMPKAPALPKIPQDGGLNKLVRQDTLAKPREKKPIATARNGTARVVKISQ